MQDISIDIGGALPYLEDRLKALWGADADTKSWNGRLLSRAKAALTQAKTVQCIGMSEPIPIERIYQPMRLESVAKNKPTDVFALIETQTDAVVFAGPGRGKTTLLNWVFVNLLAKKSTKTTPYLFVLRSANAVDDLGELATRLNEGQFPKEAKSERILLLVDGYDEIDPDDRKRVSEALTRLRSTGRASFLLTCRSFYDVYDLNAPQLTLGAFTTPDATNFIEAFAEAFGVEIKPRRLLDELANRELLELTEHPLLLALTCIVKSGPDPDLPSDAIGLLGRAFDDLTLRWDQSRGIRRRSASRLDGRDRVRCLMRLANGMQLREPQSVMEDILSEYLVVIHRPDIDPRVLLREMAQWYGVLVPIEGHCWQFVHKSIHDYLAAKYWIETGRFNSAQIRNWDARVAYALCMCPDATTGIVSSLDRHNELDIFTECVYNHAYFRSKPVARALIAFYERKGLGKLSRSTARVQIHVPLELIRVCSSAFLNDLMPQAIGRNSGAGDMLFFGAMAELSRRGQTSSSPHLYQAALQRIGSQADEIGVGDHTGRMSVRVSEFFTSEAKHGRV